MKRKITRFGCIIMLLCLISTFIPLGQANPSIYISSYSLIPEILHPGDVGLLRITISNGETTSTKTDTDYINSLPVDQTTKTVGAIIENVYITSDGDGSYDVKASEHYEDPVEIAPGSSITFEFTIRAEDNISNGIYTPIVHIKLESSSYHDVKVPITITVSDETIDVIPQNIPSSISTIGATDLSFLLVNNRNNDITNIQIIPDQTNHSYFMPSKQFVSSLSALETETVHFSLIPKNTGEYMFSLNCTYKNGENTHYKRFSIPLNLSSFYEVYPIIYSSPETIEKGETKEIRLKIYNAKNDEINAVRIKPITEAQITPNEYFIGSMDADDLYAVTFDLSTGNLSENQTYPISYEITFKQDNNVYSNIPVTTSVTVQSIEKSNGTEYIIAIIGFIILVGILFIVFYLRRKRGSA
jgi:hypothetical protein